MKRFAVKARLPRAAWPIVRMVALVGLVAVLHAVLLTWAARANVAVANAWASRGSAFAPSLQSLDTRIELAADLEDGKTVAVLPAVNRSKRYLPTSTLALEEFGDASEFDQGVVGDVDVHRPPSLLSSVRMGWRVRSHCVTASRSYRIAARGPRPST
jgi:hypothetical protein